MNQELQERRAKRFWVSLVVTLLGLQLVIGGFAFRLATSDPSVAIVPDYHTTALNWDREQRINTAAHRNGWQIQTELSDIADGNGNRAITVTVTDDDRVAVDGLRVSGQAYHHARAGDMRDFLLAPIGDGKYRTLAPLDRDGLWQLEVSVEGADEPMRLKQTIEIENT